MIDVEEGAEYEGERYIRCYRCPVAGETVLFEGKSGYELVAFLVAHDHDGALITGTSGL